MAATLNTGGSGGAGAEQSATPPDHDEMWLNTGSDNNSYGVGGVPVPKGALCYYVDTGNASTSGWKPVTAIWG